MLIDELVYDPGSDGNIGLFALTEGLFVLVSGDVARSGNMVVTTPVSTIGIRGTAVAILAAREGIANVITLLRDPNGNDGIVQVANDIVSASLEALGETATLLRRNSPINVKILSKADIRATFGAALAIMQALTGSDLGVGDGGPDDVSADEAADLLMLLKQLIEENPAQDGSPD